VTEGEGARFGRGERRDRGSKQQGEKPLCSGKQAAARDARAQVRQNGDWSVPLARPEMNSHRLTAALPPVLTNRSRGMP
jgi:hypothetical protein